MRKIMYSTVFFLCAILAASFPLYASHYRVVDGPRDFYYGRISLTDVRVEGADPLILREGETAPEIAVLNMPICPGDVLLVPEGGRCEIQFDTGTILRLDGPTELTIETVLAPSLSSNSQLSNIILSQGRIYIMYKEFNRREIFQVLTPLAALKMRHHAVTVVEAAEDGASVIRVDNGRLDVMTGSDPEATSRRTARKGDIFEITPDHRIESLASLPATDFDEWNAEINRSFRELHKGLTPLPKPIRRLSPAVQHFAQTYGDIHGEWLWDDLVGYVWRPYANAVYPSGKWSPYVYGRWQAVGDQLFWIPEEPWGWVPYHLGVWHWNEKRGWLWIPGSFFAPAWVTWEFFFGYYAWRPWSVWDWYLLSTGRFGMVEGHWVYGWPFMGESTFGSRSDAYLGRRTQIDKNQLQGPDPSLPMPGNLKRVYRTVVSALKKGDERVVASARAVPSQLVFVHREHIRSRSVHEKALSWADLADHRAALSRFLSARPEISGEGRDSGATPDRRSRIEDPSPRGLHSVLLSEFRISRPGASGDIEASGRVSIPRSGLKAPVRSERDPESGIPGREESLGRLAGDAEGRAFRFRDWNPDVPIAQRIGVTISYSSRDNAVQVPELRLTSRSGRIETGMRQGRFVTRPGSSAAGVTFTSSEPSLGTTTSALGSEPGSGSTTAGSAREGDTAGSKEVRKKN